MITWMRGVGIVAAILVSITAVTVAQEHRQPRYHSATEAGSLILQKAIMAPIAPNRISITVEGHQRVIRSNSISVHKTGQYPGPGNPNSISEQSFSVILPLYPEKLPAPRYYQLGTFGIGINGVIFEPQAAEWFHGIRGSVWQYDALGGALPLGFDDHMAHVQPNGTYHYHGLPTGLLNRLSLSDDKHSPLIGWAMDGFPIYALFGENDTGQIVEMRSGYKLKQGTRPSGGNNPGGAYDRAFLADWEHQVDAGDLDKCNGRFTKTPDFPSGTYAYFLTRSFPVVPRCFFGKTVLGAFRPEERGGMSSDTQSDREDRLQKAARILNIDARTLQRALGPPPPDFSRAARELGVEEKKLRGLLRP